MFYDFFTPLEVGYQVHHYAAPGSKFSVCRVPVHPRDPFLSRFSSTTLSPRKKRNRYPTFMGVLTHRHTFALGFLPIYPLISFFS
jgi:hypothetical protein